jgi:hypothetical protein
MYKFYNNNSLGLFENDCTIRAISLATENTWDDTYKHLSNVARINGTMMDDKDFIVDYLDKRYERIYNLPKYVGELAGMYPDNILLITMRGHITCSKYGVVYDSFDCRGRIVEYCWIVK